MALGLRFRGGVIGVEPKFPDIVYVNRTAVGAWETVTLTPAGPSKVSVLFVDANRQFCIDDRLRLVTRPAGQIGEWETFQVSPDGTSISRAGITLTIEGQPIVAPSTLHLEQRGNDFVDASGQRIVLPGIDAFLALRQYRDGGEDALRPLIDESNQLGFRVWRIWSQGSKRQNNVLDLSPQENGYYDSIRPFADFLNQHSIIPLMTAYVDNQDVQSPVSHWSELGNCLRGSASLLSGFNQWSKNKSNFDPWALPPIDGLIWSRGSDVEDTETDPRGAPASELHATRNSFDRALMDATASPPTMRQHGAGMVWMTEGNPFGDSRGYSPFEAWALGRAYSILWSLAVFHNRQSQGGQLMNSDTRACAEQWVKGMTL